MNASIVVVGSLNMDLVTNVARIPNPGETVIGGDLISVPGGKGANQAVAAARLGASVAMVGRVGDDNFAGQLLENLAAAEVDHTFVKKVRDTSTGVALIAVDAAGQNSIVVAPGANARLMPEDLAEVEPIIAGARVLLAQLEVPLKTVLRAAEMAREHGVTVVLNPAPAQQLPPELLALVDVLIPNESETEILTGLPIGGKQDHERAAAELRRPGISTVILTLGEQGALLAQDREMEHFPAYIPAQVVDTTAAGDAFVGGFAASLAGGNSIPESVRWGNAAASLAVTKMGAQTSLPFREEVMALLGAGSSQ